jgi:pimeloyl-ACP methyl ester carboxylesterase
MKNKLTQACAALILSSQAIGGAAMAANTERKAPIVLADQGSFAVGGTAKTEAGTFNPEKPLDPAGQSYHGDHAAVSYQIPVNPRKYPIVMWHGSGQSKRTWETTPDGRDGFQNIFLRQGFSTYLIDQPRRGEAGRSMVEMTVKPTADEQMWFNQFRVGVWPKYFDGVQFAKDKGTLEQYFRQMTPNTGPLDAKISSDAGAALFDKIGPGILFTHSRGGGIGWQIALKSTNVKAIVSFEPGSDFVFPEGEVPPDMPSAFDTLKGVPVPMDQFMKLTKMPIIVYYGDNIPEQPTKLPAQDSWRVRVAMAKLWVAAINKHGGDATMVHLPDIGIKGNTHFIMSDLNNDVIAGLVGKFLHDKHLD